MTGDTHYQKGKNEKMQRTIRFPGTCWPHKLTNEHIIILFVFTIFSSTPANHLTGGYLVCIMP